ncbi:MAG TPA: preprotein translocase subunit SecE [Polyangiales bacterium]
MSNEDKLESDPLSDQDEDSSDDGVETSGLVAAGSGDAGDSELTDDEGHMGAGKRTIGLERWVQLGFMAAAILLVWLFDHVINAIWYIFADPNESVVTAGAVVLGLVATVILYRNASVYSLVHGVTEELSKVAWPTRKETSSSTIVVVVTSLVAAAVLFLFDSVWSAVTDLVY